MKEAILLQLADIQRLKQAIDQRITAGLQAVYDVNDIHKTRPLDSETIEQRSADVAHDLMADSSVSYPLLIGVMHGALPFVAKVQQELSKNNYSFQFETIQVSSYEGTASGTLTIKSNSKILVGGRDVIVVDDICDTGKSYYALQNLFINQGARSVKLMALVDKAQPRESAGHVSPTYSGFTLSPTEFIVGFGMDYDELLRNVSKIGSVDLSTLPTEKEKQLLASESSLNKQLVQLISDERLVGQHGNNPNSLFASTQNNHKVTSLVIPTPHEGRGVDFQSVARI